MDNQQFITYLKYLIKFANDIISRAKIEKKDMVSLQKEWIKFQKEVQASGLLDKKIKDKIMEIKLLKKDYHGEEGSENYFQVIAVVLGSFISAWFIWFIRSKRLEKNKKIITEFRNQLSQTLFLIE